MATAEELRAALVAAFPPDVDRAVDLESGDPLTPGAHLRATAQTLTHATAAVDTLATELNPLTTVAKLPEWERVFRLRGTGSTAQRQAALLSRLRELGQVTTRGMVQSVIAPLLGYTDASELVVLETDREALRVAHTYSWSGSEDLTAGPILKFRVRDDAKVSPAGAQVDVTLASDELAELAATLTAPDGTTHQTLSPGTIGRGAYTGTIRLYFPAVAGADIGGTFGGDWQLQIAMTGVGAGTITAADLFVEGLGIDGTLNDGRGAAIYRWGVVIEDSKLGPAADLIAAREALERIRYACRPPSLLRRSVGGGALPDGDYAVIPGDPNAVPSGAVPG